MIDYTFKYNGASITIRTSSGLDYLNAQVANQKLSKILFGDGDIDAEKDANVLGVFLFTQIITQTRTVNGDLGVNIPDHNVSGDDLYNAYQTFMNNAPGKLVREFQAALHIVENPGDEDLAPPEEADPNA